MSDYRRFVQMVETRKGFNRTDKNMYKERNT